MNDYLNFDRMRFGVAFYLFALMGLSHFCSTTASAQEEIRFPYQALVSSEKAMVRSGPGELHYGTDRLDQGASVEVFRHDPGNWCAIRPLDSSFSLVPESTLKIVRDGVGEVTVDDARAWVGTHLGAVEKPLWQVKLRLGERLKVIGEVAFPNPDGHSTIWYQIKPPPGEFRWIHRDDIQALVSALPDPANNNGGLARASEQRSPVKAELMRSVLPQNRERSMEPNFERKQVLTQNPIELTQPQPDMNTRDDRVVGSGLRRDLQVDPARRVPQMDVAQVDQGIANRSYDVRQSDFVEIADSVESAESVFESDVTQQEIQLVRAQQEIVGPQDRDGINEGWRPSTRPFGQGNQSLQAQTGTIDSSRLPIASDHRDVWNTMQPSESLADDSNWRQGVMPNDRFADAVPTDRVFAGGIGDARSNPVLGTYTRMPGGVAAVEAKLTQEMLKSDPALWELDSLEQAAQSLAQTPSSAEELVNVKRLIAKIQNCQQLKFQYANERGPMGRFDIASVTGANSGADVGRVDANQNAESQFDAVGWLNELKREQGTAKSTYVLQDATGKITHHLEAAPGLSLSRYLKTRIGVVGKRGYHQGLKLDHVLVNRVYGL